MISAAHYSPIALRIYNHGAIVVIIFGPKQLPKLSKMMGKTVKNFKEGIAEETTEDEE